MSVSSCTLALLLAGASANPGCVSLEPPLPAVEPGRFESVVPMAGAVQAVDASPPIQPGAPADDAAEVSGALQDEAAAPPPQETPDQGTDMPAPVATALEEDPAGDAAAPGFESEIVVVARPRSPQDPLVGLNLKSFETIQVVDKALVGPMAMTYKETIPKPVRSGVRNFLRNLTEPVVFLNFLLQLKPGKAAETVGRFAVNSTIGVAGLFDVAKKEPFNLPYRNNGFGNTLGYYGVKQGAFLFLPLIGPTTVRDLAGRTLDMMVMPFAFGRPFNDPVYVIPTTVVRLLDERAESDDEIEQMRSGSTDYYTAVREHYLKRRQAEIDALRGRKPVASEPALPMPAIEPLSVPQLPQ